MGRKHFAKRGKCWLPAFSPFSRMVSKGFFFRVVKCQDFVVKSLQKFYCSSKLKALADDKVNVAQVSDTYLREQTENIMGKGENAGYQHFFLFP